MSSSKSRVKWSSGEGVGRSVSRRLLWGVVLALVGLLGSAAAATEIGSFTLTAANAHGVVLWESTTGTPTATSAAIMTNGQLLVGSTGADPAPATLGTGTGISISTGAGTLTVNNTGVTSVANGAGISVSTGTGAVTITNTLATRTVTAKTTGYSVLSGDTATFFTNTGAGGSVIFTLPTAAAGLNYTFYVDAAQTLEVLAGSSTTIKLGGSTSGAAGNITNAVQGGCVTLIAISTTQWVAIGYTGSWTVTYLERDYVEPFRFPSFETGALAA